MSDRDSNELLVEFLRANDTPCPLCGYNLRQLTTATCPECGRPFQLGVESVSPFFAHYLGFLAPFIIVAGLGFVFLCLIFAWGPPGSWGIFIIIASRNWTRFELSEIIRIGSHREVLSRRCEIRNRHREEFRI